MTVAHVRLFAGGAGTLLVGILSDSHGRHLAVRQAMELFDKLGVSHVIHCGDVGSQEVFDEMIGRPLNFVWGNMDFPNDTGLLTYAQSLGLAIPQEVPVRIDLDAKRFAVFHGHEPGFNTAIQAARESCSPRSSRASVLTVDYILHGHTHAAGDEKLNGKRVINPGALHRAARKTVATLDTETDQLTFHEIRQA